MNDNRLIRKLTRDPNRWADADLQRKFWIWKGIRILSTSALISCGIIVLGIYVQTHGGN